VGQIHKRGREYENSISIDYLSRLNERYEGWIQTYDKGKLLIIDVDNINFVDNPEDLGNIFNRIDAELHGLLILSPEASDLRRKGKLNKNEIKNALQIARHFFQSDLYKILLRSINFSLNFCISTFKTLNIFFTVNSCFDSRFYSIYICFSMDTRICYGFRVPAPLNLHY
jgi:hypothetical protein